MFTGLCESLQSARRSEYSDCVHVDERNRYQEEIFIMIKASTADSIKNGGGCHRALLSRERERVQIFFCQVPRVVLLKHSADLLSM